jgi:ABC-type nitrate/sulfonate/bicarbonate transport system substrate-binding protein
LIVHDLFGKPVSTFPDHARGELVLAFRIVLALAALLVGSPLQAQTTTLRFGQIPSTAHGVSSLSHFIAERQGFFAREHIALEIVQIPGGTGNMVAALDRGEVDVAQTATPYLVQAVLNGSNAAAIAGGIGNPLYSLIAKPQIETFADLKGRVIGLSLPVDTISISTRKLLALRGLGDADYRVKELVGSPARAACLKDGACDAVPLGQPDDLVAVKDGFRLLGVSTEAVASFQFEVMAARRDFAAAHPALVTGFVRALADAFRFIRAPEHRDEVAKAIFELTGVSDDIARATLKLYLDPDRGVLPHEAEIDLKGFAQVISFMEEGGAINPPAPTAQQFVDLRYLEAAGVK